MRYSIRISVGVSASRSQAPTGPAVLPLLLRRPNATTFSTRVRRARSYAASAPGTSADAATQRPSVTASSIAIDAPCPDDGEAAWAASPISTDRPVRHTGTRGRSKVFHGPSTSPVASMIAAAGPASPATRLVNVAQRNSVYQALDRLVRDGLARPAGTTRDGGRPERTAYEITEDGAATLRTWLAAMVTTPAREFPEFPAALAFLAMIPPAEVRTLLEARIDAQQERLTAIEAQAPPGLPRIFLIEDEYRPPCCAPSALAHFS